MVKAEIKKEIQNLLNLMKIKRQHIQAMGYNEGVSLRGKNGKKSHFSK